jgi:putative acetyltransferase
MPYLPVLHTIDDGIKHFAQVVFRECRVLVVEQDERIVAYCAFREGWLEHLYVSPEVQGQGLGTALLTRAMKPGSSLRLWVFQRNSGARRFYERHGFSLVQLTDGKSNEEREPDALYGRP